MHETADVPNEPPPSLHGKAEADLHAIHGVGDRGAAEAALDRRFVAQYGARYGKAAACPAEGPRAVADLLRPPRRAPEARRAHENPIEGTLAPVRPRADRTEGRPSRATAALAMVVKLARSAERPWRRLDGAGRLAEVVRGVRFRDGEVADDAADKAAA